MSIGEELLAKHGGNKLAASVELVLAVMRGDPETYHLGYSIGSALYAAIDTYNLTVREVPLVAERVSEMLAMHHSASRRPLVIVHVGGGMVQWTREFPGIGTPRIHVLDFDKEGAEEQELRDFLDEIDATLRDIGEYHDTPFADHDVGYTLALSRNEVQDHIDEGTSMSRYR